METVVKTRLKQTLKVIYQLSRTNYGTAPSNSSPVYKKYTAVKLIIDQLEQTNFLEAMILRKRILQAKSYETIAIELSYTVGHIKNVWSKAVDLFVAKAVEMKIAKM